MVRVYKGYDTRTGKKAEVAFDHDDPREVWFPATVLKNYVDAFQVEYQKPGHGDQAVLHKATVDFWHIRPPPTHLRDKDIGLNDEVDAYYDYGWWYGIITKIFPDHRYSVFFKHSNKEREFICSKVRPHREWSLRRRFVMSQDWYFGSEDWYLGSSKGDKENIACDLHTNQIELTTPNTGTQSTGATSIMKPAKQTIVNSYDDNSPPSKKKKNESVLDDSSKKTNGTLAGQSESLDSEFGKTENLSHGKKLRSTRGKGSEQEPPAMDYLKEKRKAANENTSSNLDEGAKDDSGKTKNQQSLVKDATKGLVLPVVTGLQYNEITVSQEKIIKKCSNEIVPSVAEGDAKQLDAPSKQLTVVDKEVHEENASSVASKRKRGGPPNLQAKSPKTPLTDDHRNEGVDPSAVSVVESAQMKESSPTRSGAKSLEPLQQDKLHNESQEQDLKAKRSRKKYSFGRRKRGKRRTFSINTEAPIQDSQDASKEKADENMETSKTDPSARKLLDIVSDDQPLSRWIDGMHSPIPIHSPASERRLEAVTCDMIAGNLPFVKRTPLWHTIEAMEAFQKIPQNPHFRPLLEGVKESAREGLAIGMMVTFSTMVDRIYCLGFEDPRSTIEDCLETLVELESNGFNVEVIRDRLTRLLLLKDKKEELEDWSKGVEEKLEQKIQEKTIDDEVDVFIEQIRQLEEKRRKVLLKKETLTLEIGAIKATEEAIEQEILEVAAEFDGLAAAPF